MSSDRNTARRGGLKNVRILTVAAVLTAISFLLGFLAKLLQGTGALRLTLENLPVVFAGVTFGPWIGAAVGAGADLLSVLAAGQSWNPAITLGAAAVGLVSGFAARAFGTKKRTYLRILTCDFAGQAIGSILIKSAALAFYYGIDVAFLCFRIPIYCAVSLVESYLLYLLFSSPIVQRSLERNGRS